MLYLQMEPLFAPVLLWGRLPSKVDHRLSEWILVRLVGCISLDIS
jgi:hypothetical protein